MNSTNSLISWPTLLPESNLAAHTVKSRRNKPALVKPMPPVPAPDEETINKLNALAGRHPFCTLHKVKKHDTL
jgi:hypothetical protein